MILGLITKLFSIVQTPLVQVSRHERVNPFILRALLEHRHAWTNDTSQNNFGIEQKFVYCLMEGCVIDFDQHISFIYFLRNALVSRTQPQSKNKPRHKLFDLSCNSPRQPRFNGTGELGYDRLNGTRKIGPSYAKSGVYI